MHLLLLRPEIYFKFRVKLANKPKLIFKIFWPSFFFKKCSKTTNVFTVVVVVSFFNFFFPFFLIFLLQIVNCGKFLLIRLLTPYNSPLSFKGFCFLSFFLEPDWMILIIGSQHLMSQKIMETVRKILEI